MEHSLNYPRFLPVGDAALTVEFGDAIAPESNARVIALDVSLAASDVDGIVETVPSFRSLLICYDPTVISADALVGRLRGLIAQEGYTPDRVPREWHVPVAYDAEFSTDLEEVAARLGLSPAEVISIHTGAAYQVYMVGFAPGIPVMGGLSPSLHIPRRPNPRPEVPAGAVVIAGMQASIISMPVPSGWYVLGRTPLRVFDPRREDPFLFRPGDTVRFHRIAAADYARMANLPPDRMLAIARRRA